MMPPTTPTNNPKIVNFTSLHLVLLTLHLSISGNEAIKEVNSQNDLALCIVRPTKPYNMQKRIPFYVLQPLQIFFSHQLAYLLSEQYNNIILPSLPISHPLRLLKFNATLSPSGIEPHPTFLIPNNGHQERCLVKDYWALEKITIKTDILYHKLTSRVVNISKNWTSAHVIIRWAW